MSDKERADLKGFKISSSFHFFAGALATEMNFVLWKLTFIVIFVAMPGILFM